MIYIYMFIHILFTVYLWHVSFTNKVNKCFFHTRITYGSCEFLPMSTVAGVGFVSRKLCGLLPPALRTQVSSKGKKNTPWPARGGETGPWVCCCLAFIVQRLGYSALRKREMSNVKRASGCWWLRLLLFNVVSLQWSVYELFYPPETNIFAPEIWCMVGKWIPSGMAYFQRQC